MKWLIQLLCVHRWITNPDKPMEEIESSAFCCGKKTYVKEYLICDNCKKEKIINHYN